MINRVLTPLSTTCTSLNGGADAVAGIGENYLFSVTSTWNTGDLLTINLTDYQTGLLTQIGAGYVTSQQPTFCFTFNEKAYTLSGSTVYFSALNNATIWNDPNASGNGFVSLQDQFGTSENIVSMESFQGNLAFFGRNHIQIWSVNADPNQWQLSQVLQNIGTNASQSVHGLGDLDVMFLSDTGIRSLRARETTLNAFVNDLGSPVDLLVQQDLLAGNYSTACGVVEPSTGQYWCYLNGKIYVLSYYPSNKIAAWSQYFPKYFAPVSSTTTVVEEKVTVTFNTADTTSYLFVPISGNPTLVNTNRGGSPTQNITEYGIFTTFGDTNAVTISFPEITPFPQFLVLPLTGATTFSPTQFVIYNGQVYASDANGIYLYGGPGNGVYDNTSVVAATSWLDLKHPDNIKRAIGVDSAFTGTWTFYGGQDQLDETLTQLWTGSQATFQQGKINFPGDGYHVKLQAVSQAPGPAVLSSLIFRFTEEGEK